MILFGGVCYVFELYKIDGLSYVEVVEWLGILKSGVEKYMVVVIKYFCCVLLD